MTNCSEKSIVPQPFLAPITRYIFGLAYRLLGGIWAYGAENVPNCGPVIFCPNHLSDSDASALYVTSPRRDIYFIARHELFQTPLLGPFMTAFGGIPIHRDSSDIAGLKTAINIVSKASALVLFPEGRLAQDSKLQKIQPGAALIAIKSGAPIVPVGLTRTNWFLPYGDVFPRRSHLPARVIFGKPIWPAEFEHLKGRTAVDAMTAKLEEQIRELTGQ
jgi:1-acyl-sn-glycerol-3-phosphate acyltransferase